MCFRPTVEAYLILQIIIIAY
uniref:Uncharacterized protein n=1 Tax=Anguilla anguilla TaxID=7936 RepID=A0A0E9Q1P0_ANGAN